MRTAVKEQGQMSNHEHSGNRTQERSSFLISRAGLALIGFLAITGALLLTEHRWHVLGVLIWLPLLACPLLHMFMHGGHGGHGAHAGGHDDPTKRDGGEGRSR
jgi:hypothetical protein